MYSPKMLYQFNRLPWLASSIALALMALLTLQFTLVEMMVVYASSNTLYVDGSSGNDAANNCQNSMTPCSTIAHALSEAASDDLILIAEDIYTETIDISKNVTIKGGYEATNWMQDVSTNPTIINGNNINDYVIEIQPSAIVTIEGFTVQGGNSPSEGGGFFINEAAVVISGTIVKENTAVSSGGGIWVEGSANTLNVDIINSQLLTNTAGGIGGGIGGCCVATGNLISLTNVIVQGNNAQGDGGGIGISSTLHITNSQILSNTSAGSGGGIQASIVSIHNSKIRGNEANGNNAIFGGGIRAMEKLMLEGSTVSDNKAVGTSDSIGGGIAAETADTTIIGTRISNNTADYNAGVSLYNSVFTMTNSLIVNNQGTALGGNPITGTLTNMTIANNGGSGILGIGGDILILNTIMWGNTGNDYVCANNCSLAYSLVGIGDTTGTDNVSSDPLFIGNDNYQLQLTSPAVDSGSNVGAPITDFARNIRPVDGDNDGTAVTDMGAFELIPKLIYLPHIIKNNGS